MRLRSRPFPNPSPSTRRTSISNWTCRRRPAVMVAEEIVVEGADVAEAQLEAVICRHLGLPLPEPEKIGFLKRLFGK